MDITLFLTLFHIIGVAIGVGGATVSDVLFFRALKDRRISKDELGLLHTLGMLIWAGLAILVASGVGFVSLELWQAGTSYYLASAWFQAKLCVLSLLFLNALVMHWYIFPVMQRHLGKRLTYQAMKPHLALFATSGVVSIVSWYTALTLGVTRGLDFSVGFILNAYLLILVAGAMVSYTILSLSVFKRPDSKETLVEPGTPRSLLKRKIILIILAVVLGVILVSVAWKLAHMGDGSNRSHYHTSDVGHDEYGIADGHHHEH